MRSVNCLGIYVSTANTQHQRLVYRGPSALSALKTSSSRPPDVAAAGLLTFPGHAHDMSSIAMSRGFDFAVHLESPRRS